MGGPIEDRERWVRVGGLVDRTHVTLGIHGDDLDPDEISRLLGRGPTRSHRKGDPLTRSHPESSWRAGAWLLTVEGEAPQGPEELLDLLLRQVPEDPLVWDRLGSRCVSFGIFTREWNRGFDLSSVAIDRLKNLGCEVNFDIYVDDERDE